jgi:hypothetical protein
VGEILSIEVVDIDEVIAGTDAEESDIALTGRVGVKAVDWMK